MGRAPEGRAQLLPLGGRIAVALALLLFARPAFAEPSEEELATARRLFQEATEMRQAEDWAGAALKLREALAIKETPGLRFHLAHCEERTGNLTEARADYERADALVRAGAAAPDVAALLGPARASLDDRIPTLTVKLPPDARKARVSVDGDPVTPELAAGPLRLNPGFHVVDVVADERRPFHLELTLGEGDDRSVEAVLSPRAQEAVPPPPEKPSAAPPRDRVPSQSTFGARELALVAEGTLFVGGLVAGVVFSVQKGAASDRADNLGAEIDQRGGPVPASSRCHGAGASDPTCEALRDALGDASRDEKLSVAGFAGAALGAAAFGTTWFVWPRNRSTVGVRVVPLPFGTAVHGTF